MVTLGRGQGATSEQMKAIYGVSNPPYSSSNPIAVLACAAITDPGGPIVDSILVELTITSDGP